MANYRDRVPVEERFDRYVVRKEDPDACWDWLGARDKGGYGVLSVPIDRPGQRSIRTINIVSYNKYIGTIPYGLSVLHTCDNPSCSNPKHLFLGTQQQNMADMVIKDRSAKHENHSQAKITMEIARHIRHLRAICNESNETIGRRFGITRSTVRAIILNITWKEE